VWRYRIDWHSSAVSTGGEKASPGSRSAVVTVTSKLRSRAVENLLSLEVWTEGNSKFTIFSRLTMNGSPVVGARVTAKVTFIPLEQRDELSVSAVKRVQLAPVQLVDDGHAGE